MAPRNAQTHCTLRPERETGFHLRKGAEKSTCVSVESVVRATVRTAICDGQFRRVFIDDGEIRRRWDR